ncbi:MAG: hypothetical protein IKU07_07975 [Oscillospiraceae bacterium]|nr:hypothetical protein [Oscillospiraceae bacterium]
MKKCPFCNAEIEENARFCLYCMQPLEKKQVIDPQPQKKNHLLLLWLILPVLLVVVLLLPRGEKPSDTASETTPPTEAETTAPTANEDTTPPEEEYAPEASEGTEQLFFPGVGTQNQTVPSDTAPQSTTPQPTTPLLPETTVPQTTLPSVTLPPTEPTEPATTAPTESTPPPIDYGNGIPGTEGYRTQLSIQFPYSDDDYPTFAPVGIDVFAYIECTEDFEILGHTIKAGQYTVYGKDQNRCGIYEVSPYVHGKKVVAIEAATDLVKVTIPETVVVIGNYAFARGNQELKYLCFKGDQITMPENALPPMAERWYTIVIRCSAQCKNAQGEYWKDIAGRYGAVWEEWNG